MIAINKILEDGKQMAMYNQMKKSKEEETCTREGSHSEVCPLSFRRELDNNNNSI